MAGGVVAAFAHFLKFGAKKEHDDDGGPHA
jgi:hypothetical protein